MLSFCGEEGCMIGVVSVYISTYNVSLLYCGKCRVSYLSISLSLSLSLSLTHTNETGHVQLIAVAP
jgi:hypothetical protein